MTGGTSSSQDTPFDRLAADYDASFTATALGRWLRATVWRRLDECFNGRRRILDIGCGTGEDAIHLASRGHDVVATDVSASMLAVAARKALRIGCADRIELRRIAIEQLAAELRGERFDGALSNFGALNCAADLERAIADVAGLLRPGAPLVLVVMGRWVPWEWSWFLARLQWRQAFRRLSREGARWNGMTIRYPSPGTLTRMLGPAFATRARRGLGIVLPPTYASGWLETRPRVLAALTKLEDWLARSTALAGLADHYVIEAMRGP